MDDPPLMDDLLEWLALGFWTTPKDELEMVLFFGTPSNLNVFFYDRFLLKCVKTGNQALCSLIM